MRGSSPRVWRALTALAGVTAATLALTACGTSSSAGSASQSNGKIKVVASTNVWGSVVQAVGGDAVEVRSIIDTPSADPHSYESKPADATALAGATLAVYNGGGYDDFFVKLVDNAGRSAHKIVAFDVSGQPAGPDANEHVWYDLPSVRKVADKVAEELGDLDAARKDVFLRNARDFTDKVDILLAKVRKIGVDHPGARVMVTEPVPDYLLRAAGLSDVTPKDFVTAIEEQTDPSAAAVAEANNLITGRQVALLVNNEQTESPITMQLSEKARAAGVPVVGVTETLPPGVSGYLDWMTRQVDALSGGLAGK